MRARLPPLKTLEGFDAAARLGSFAAAAELLGLTQSAISHQIRTLEEGLNQQLFRRVHRRVALTDAGRDFHRTVRQVMQTLQEGVKRLEPYRNQNAVIIYCDSALADGWLVHELQQLRLDLPELDVWLDSSGKQVSFELDEVDVIISTDETYGDEFEAEPRLRLPLAFRALAREDVAAGLAAQLEQGARETLPLIHLEGVVGWEAWIRAAGVDEPEEVIKRVSHRLIVSDPYLALRGACDGLGACLAPELLGRRFVADGALQWIGETRLASPHSYCVWVNPARHSETNIGAFADWVSRRLTRLSQA
jgi:LysR family glycine cleavage system transcriptional activator